MRPFQISIGRDAAIRLADSGWWKGKDAREVVRFQLHTAELCMPFGEFHRCIEESLGRPVWTHEFGLNLDGLREELEGRRPAPSFDEIVGLLPVDKVILVRPQKRDVDPA